MKCLSMKRYLGETSLHGFGYTDDKNKFVVVFWALLTSICIYYCINDIVLLVQAYLLVPTAVFATVAPNRNIILPTPTLCMEIMVPAPHTTSDPQACPMLNFTVRDISQDIAAFMSATNNGSRLNLTGKEMRLTDRLEYLTYLMLGYITDIELIYTGEHKPTYTEYVTKYNATYGYNTFCVPSALLFQDLTPFVYNIYMSYSVSLGNLKRLVGMSICSKQIESAWYGSLLGNNKGLSIASMCQADTVTHLSFSLVCVKLFNTSTYTITDGLAVSLDGLTSASKLPFPGCMRGQKSQDKLQLDTNNNFIPPNVAYVNFQWYIDLRGRSVIPTPPFQDIIIMDPAYPALKYDVTVSAEYQFCSTPRKPCSSDIRQQDCIRQGKVEMVSQHCSCWPSTILGVDNVNNMPACSYNPTNPSHDVLTNFTYPQCNKVPDDNVVVLCTPDCNAYLYDVGMVDAAASASLQDLDINKWFHSEAFGSSIGSVEITFQSESLRSLIVEYPAMPFTAFACSFGGIIGTYLGGSILAIVHIPIFILAQLTSLMTKRNKVENISKADAKGSNIAKEEIYPPVMSEAKVV